MKNANVGGGFVATEKIRADNNDSVDYEEISKTESAEEKQSSGKIQGENPEKPRTTMKKEIHGKFRAAMKRMIRIRSGIIIILVKGGGVNLNYSVYSEIASASSTQSPKHQNLK